MAASTGAAADAPTRSVCGTTFSRALVAARRCGREPLWPGTGTRGARRLALFLLLRATTGTAIAIQNDKREWQKKQTIAGQGFDPDQRQPVCVCNHTLLGC